MLRLAGLIAFLILAVVLLVVAVRGCASNSKHDRYANYITDIRRVAAGSTSIGKQLNSTLAATGPRGTIRSETSGEVDCASALPANIHDKARR